MTKERESPGRDRIELVDALRGFALFGILLANILYWSGWVLVTPTERLAMADANVRVWQYRFHHLLIDGKFYTLFSLLFGVGFAIQLDRLTRRGADGLRIYRRRVLILLAMGLVHSWLIWDGDILTLYALLGLVLPLFIGWSDRALLIGAATLIFVVPIAGITLFDALGWQPELWFFGLSDRITQALGVAPGPDLALRLLRNNDLTSLMTWTLSGTPYSWGLRLESWRIPKILGIMLVGMWVGRRLAAGTLAGDRRLLWRIMGLALLIGLPANLAYALTPGLGQASAASVIGTVPLAFAYAAGFALLWPKARPWLGLFAAPGRMALTNYLLHSLIGALIFYGIGLGLIGKLSPPGFYAIAVTIFAAQTGLSRWWLAHHAQGPIEGLWRRSTLWRQPLTKTAR